MMLSRRMPSPTSSRTKKPLSSGPRWTIVEHMLCTSSAATGRPSRLRIPAMPHMEWRKKSEGSNIAAQAAWFDLEHAFGESPRRCPDSGCVVMHPPKPNRRVELETDQLPNCFRPEELVRLIAVQHVVLRRAFANGISNC